MELAEQIAVLEQATAVDSQSLQCLSRCLAESHVLNLHVCRSISDNQRKDDHAHESGHGYYSTGDFTDSCHDYWISLRKLPFFAASLSSLTWFSEFDAQSGSELD